MAETKSPTPGDDVFSAEDLRKRMLEREMAEMQKEEEARRRKLKENDAFVDAFLTHHVSDDERATIRRLIRIAAENGKTEALVYSFPSDLCTDGGRAINSAQPDWPDSLQGKARELYERYMEVAKPKGYRLKAMIINFPGGIPGDVGFFLDWS